MGFGIENVTDDQEKMYRAVLEKLEAQADPAGQWKKIPPRQVEVQSAPCKEVVLTGDDVDLFNFPWLKGNPADGGRYVNSGSVVLYDKDFGHNVGTYRCQVKGKTKTWDQSRAWPARLAHSHDEKEPRRESRQRLYCSGVRSYHLVDERL